MKSVNDDYWYSENTARSVRRLTQKIADGNFIEDDIKALVLDLREFARNKHTAYKNEIKDQSKIISLEENKEFYSLYGGFLDLADFVAHPNKNQGTLHDKMVENSDALTLAARENRLPTREERPTVVEAQYYAFILILCIEGFLKNPLPENFRKKIIENVNDIELCLLLITQDSRITLKGERGFALLNIRPVDGKFNLSARLFGSEGHGLLQASRNQEVITDFTLIPSNAPVFEGFEAPAFNVIPPVFEGYRDQENKFKIRLIQPNEAFNY